MPKTTWIPCEKPTNGRKVARAGISPPWFASAERFGLEFFRADSQLYACVTNKGEKPKGGGLALAAGQSQWYVVERS